jgi:hypothetical protein
VPPLHILRAYNGEEYRFYELTGDQPEALHFRHFEQTELPKPAHGRVRIKDASLNSTSGRVKLRDGS